MAKKDRDKEKEIDKEENKELDEEKEGGKGVLALVTVLIIIIWLGIIAILIKTDVGGFGSTVLYPILKDVPYINKILPNQDINEYKTYYESIDPENAEVLYKQVVEQITYDDEVQDYAKTYSQMKPKEAAAIFDTMTDNLGLVSDILMCMGAQARADILGKMNAETAAKLTEIMEPSKK